MSYTKILKEFGKKRILVIGDLILDRYIWGRVDRISPEAPVPIVEVTKEDFLLGGASNVANNIIALGGSATIVGVIGNDRAGDVLTNLLDKQGIQYQGVFRCSRNTIVITRVIAHNQQVVRFDKEDKDRPAGNKPYRTARPHPDGRPPAGSPIIPARRVNENKKQNSTHPEKSPATGFAVQRQAGRSRRWWQCLYGGL